MRRFLREALGSLWEPGRRPGESPSATTVRLGTHDVMPHWGPRQTRLLLSPPSQPWAATLPTAGRSGELLILPPYLDGGNVKNLSCHIKASPRHEKCLSRCILPKQDFHSNFRRCIYNWGEVQADGSHLEREQALPRGSGRSLPRTCHAAM